MAIIQCPSCQLLLLCDGTSQKNNKSLASKKNYGAIILVLERDTKKQHLWWKQSIKHKGTSTALKTHSSGIERLDRLGLNGSKRNFIFRYIFFLQNRSSLIFVWKKEFVQTSHTSAERCWIRSQIPTNSLDDRPWRLPPGCLAACLATAAELYPGVSSAHSN